MTEKYSERLSLSELRITAYSTPETGERLYRIFRLPGKNRREDRFRAVSLYYEFYADLFFLFDNGDTYETQSVLPFALRSDVPNRVSVRITVSGSLLAHCYISASRLYHLFQSELARTLIRFRNGLRMKKAARESGKGSRSVEENAELCGFPFAAHSRKIFRAVTGMTPAGHRGLVHGTIEESVRGVLKREPDRSTGLKSVFRISSFLFFDPFLRPNR